MKEIILDTITDLVSNFLYYDRKEDEELPRGFIESAIESGSVTVDELVSKFKGELEGRLNNIGE